MRRYFVLLLMAAFSLSCLDVAEDRIENEIQVGFASTQETSISVRNGHAAIRSFSPDRAVIWANAPALTIDLENVSTPFELEVRNAMPSARLTVVSGDASTTTLTRSIPTRKAWQLSGTEATTTVEIAAPDARDSGTWRFVVFADVQDHIDDVQDIYEEMQLDPSIRFGLISGDLTEQGTREELLRFQREMETLRFPLYATIGNHELGAEDVFFYELWGRANTSFTFRGARFTLLDSSSATIAPTAWEWFEEWLDEGSNQPHLVMMHIPPLDSLGFRNGGFASRAEANRLIKEMADHGVDQAVYGHVHTYDAFTHAGIPAIITGGGGAIPMRLDGIGRHFLTVDVDVARRSFNASVQRVFPE